MPEIDKIEQLCKSVNRIVKHHKELAKVKGETFNVFSVLNIETKEVLTHSRFIAELLNPKGSHLKGAVFLQHFMKVLHNTELLTLEETEVKKKFVASNKTNVIVEKYLGEVNLEEATGGNIDILLTDVYNNSISIENKIYASDQPLQMVRYYKYNTHKNTLYYLSLNENKKPEEFSTTHVTKDNKELLKLIENTHYVHITYKEHILNWLDLCLKETIDQPILRETIKQYILLIKKLTNTLDTAANKELTEVIFNNLDSAKHIADNYYKLLNTTKATFRKAVFKKLTKALDDTKYKVTLGKEVTSENSPIFVELIYTGSNQLYFGIESFSGRGNLGGDMFVGILDVDGKSSAFKSQAKYNKMGNWWPHIEKIKLYGGEKINLSNSKLLKLLHDPTSSEYELIVNHICNQFLDFLNANETHVASYLMSKKE